MQHAWLSTAHSPPPTSTPFTPAAPPVISRDASNTVGLCASHLVQTCTTPPLVSVVISSPALLVQPAIFRGCPEHHRPRFIASLLSLMRGDFISTLDRLLIPPTIGSSQLHHPGIAMHDTLPSDHAPAFFTASRKLRRRPEPEPHGAYSVGSPCPGLGIIATMPSRHSLFVRYVIAIPPLITLLNLISIHRGCAFILLPV